MSEKKRDGFTKYIRKETSDVYENEKQRPQPLLFFNYIGSLVYFPFLKLWCITINLQFILH
jgi:hypothetical protein